MPTPSRAPLSLTLVSLLMRPFQINDLSDFLLTDICRSLLGNGLVYTIILDSLYYLHVPTSHYFDRIDVNIYLMRLPPADEIGTHRF